MPKQINLNLEARQKLLAGARVLAKATAVTYGPKGRTVMLDRVAGLLATKDGVTVAREIVLEDPIENMGAVTVREACIKVNDLVGDGTTTAAILSAALLEEGHKLVVAGHDPMRIANGIREAAEEACAIIDDIAVRIENQEELERVAFVASNGDVEVSKALAEACMAVGNDGTISIEDGHGVDIQLVYKDGMEIDRGALSGGFLRDSEALEREMENPLVAVIGARLVTVQDVTQILEEASQWPDNHLIVFAESVEGPALTTMVLNDSKRVVRSVAVDPPGFGAKKLDSLRDLAALSGATYVDPTFMNFKEKFDPEWFGSLRKATIKQKSSMLVAHDEARGVIAERIQELKREHAGLRSDYDRDRHAERIAKLAGGLCIMRVGGPTEPELKERRARVEDALGAVRAALEQGVVPGAGTSYKVVAESLQPPEDDPDTALGWKVMIKALSAPLIHLANNAGHEGNAIAAHVLGENIWSGWDVMLGEFRDLSESPPVIDPAPVAKTVIEAAASVAATLLTAEVSIANA